jgi:hypothetical protein
MARLGRSLLPTLGLSFGLTSLAAAPAVAQPGAPPPTFAPAPAYVAVVPVTPVPVVIVARPEPPRWGIGLHLGGMGVESEAELDDGDAAQKTDLGVLGVQLRFRLHRRWELELDLSHMEGELEGPGGLTRSSGAVVLGGMFHINPDSRWLWSVLAGVGGTRDRVWFEKDGDRETQAEFAGGLFRIGVGVERRFDSLGIAAQLYGVGLERNDEELDGPAFVGREGPVPERSSGGLFQIVGNYYF